MARILVMTNDGRATLLDEKDVGVERLNSESESVNLLERLEWAIRDADRSHRNKRHEPRRLPAERTLRRSVRH